MEPINSQSHHELNGTRLNLATIPAMPSRLSNRLLDAIREDEATFGRVGPFRRPIDCFDNQVAPTPIPYTCQEVVISFRGREMIILPVERL